MADLKITLTVSETDQKVLKNDMLSITEWADGALAGVINHAWKRMQSEWATKLINDEDFNEPIPSNKDDFVELVTSRADYKDRTSRSA